MFFWKISFFYYWTIKYLDSSYKIFHEKKIVHLISIQKLTVYDVVSLNDLRLTDRKQNRRVTKCSNNKTNHKIWFLFICHSNVDFFLYWYENNQIHNYYFDWSSYNTQIIINQMNIKYQILILFFFWEFQW